ncbi:SRPBCC family protein [Hyphobacterium sp.]|uniref:SRPBCC family protein n=1 Tax=Hyphobacterium sp. TaxID=2004662 RepID=UPI003BA9E71D
MSESQSWVQIEREIDARIETVWAMWTDPDLFKRWYGPKGITIPVVEMDVRVGGKRKIGMEMQRPDGVMAMWFTGIYKEVSAPSRLVYTEAMCTADGTLIPPASMGMPEGTPDFTEVRVELSEADGRTLMKMTHIGVPEGSAGEGGWNQAIDKLVTLATSSN